MGTSSMQPMMHMQCIPPDAHQQTTHTPNINIQLTKFNNPSPSGTMRPSASRLNGFEARAALFTPLTTASAPLLSVSPTHPVSSCSFSSSCCFSESPVARSNKARCDNRASSSLEMPSMSREVQSSSLRRDGSSTSSDEGSEVAHVILVGRRRVLAIPAK
ncbi:unnamed protein product [Ectocarpus sp. 8 AP-2014]